MKVEIKPYIVIIIFFHCFNIQASKSDSSLNKINTVYLSQFHENSIQAILLPKYYMFKLDVFRTFKYNKTNETTKYLYYKMHSDKEFAPGTSNEYSYTFSIREDNWEYFSKLAYLKRKYSTLSTSTFDFSFYHYSNVSTRIDSLKLIDVNSSYIQQLIQSDRDRELRIKQHYYSKSKDIVRDRVNDKKFVFSPGKVSFIIPYDSTYLFEDLHFGINHNYIKNTIVDIDTKRDKRNAIGKSMVLTENKTHNGESTINFVTRFSPLDCCVTGRYMRRIFDIYKFGEKGKLLYIIKDDEDDYNKGFQLVIHLNNKKWLVLNLKFEKIVEEWRGSGHPKQGQYEKVKVPVYCEECNFEFQMKYLKLSNRKIFKLIKRGKLSKKGVVVSKAYILEELNNCAKVWTFNKPNMKKISLNKLRNSRDYEKILGLEFDELEVVTKIN